MKSIWTIGDIVCEIMRPNHKIGLGVPDFFRGPYASGAPAIFADTVAKLGYKSGIVGTVGDDAFGHMILKKLQNDGVDCRYIYVHPTLSTGVAFVSYENADDRNFIYHLTNSAAGELVLPQKYPEDIGMIFVNCAAAPDSDKMLKAINEMVKHCKNHGALFALDPNMRPEFLKKHTFQEIYGPMLEYCNILMPGVSELLALTGCDNIEHAIERAFKNSELQVLVLKKSSKGSVVISRTEKVDVPAYYVPPVDTTGAGDTFCGGFLGAYMEGLSLKECAEIGSAASAINISAFGPMEGNITMENVRQFIKHYTDKGEE